MGGVGSVLGSLGVCLSAVVSNTLFFRSDVVKVK